MKNIIKNITLCGLVAVGAGMGLSSCEDFLTITPGIRFPENEAADQKRIMTPENAKKAGSDYIVVGRPITASPDPLASYERCVREFCTGS